MSESCVFCKIAAGEIPARIILDTDDVVAFNDANPVAEKHVLVIPRKHCDNLMEQDDPALASALHEAIRETARRVGVDKSGFRLISNCGEDGGQTVKHLHYHIIGGRPLGARLL